MGKFQKVFFLYVLFCFAGINLFTQEIDCCSKYSQAESLQKNGEYEKAVELLESALESCSVKLFKIKFLSKLGVLLWNRGKVEKAYGLFRRVYELSLEMNDQKLSKKYLYYLEVLNLYDRGKKERNNNNDIDSIQYFTKAAFLSEKIGSKELELKCLRQLSVSYWYVNEFDRFLILNKKCINLAKSIKHLKEESKCLINLGIYYDLYNNYSLSLLNFFEALKIAEENNFIEEKSSAFINISTIYFNLGDYTLAYKYLLRAYEIDKATGNNEEFIAQDLNNLGLIKRYLYKKNKKESYFIDSINHFFEGMELAEKKGLEELEIKIINNLGNLYLDSGDYKKAILFFKAGLDKRNQFPNLESEAMLFVNIGFSYLELNKWGDSLENFKKALATGRKIGVTHVLWEIYFGLGRYYERQNKIIPAIKWFEKSVSSIEKIKENISLDIHMAGYISDKIQVYEHLLNLYFVLYQKNLKNRDLYIQKMFSLAEKAKARVLIENLLRSKVDVYGKINPELKNKKSRIERDLNRIMKKLSENNVSFKYRESLKQKYHKLEEENLLLLSKIQNKYPNIARVSLPDSINIEKVQKFLIKSNSLLVEYFLGHRGSFVFFISPTQKAVFSLPAGEILKKTIYGTLKLISSSRYDLQAAQEPLLRITREILPFLFEIKSIYDNLIIIPDGILYYFPFEALIYKSGLYLIDKFTVSYMPSSYSLLNLKETPKETETDSRLLLFGSPENSHTGVLSHLYEAEEFSFPPIPHSRDEIEEIKNIFPGNLTDVYTGREASESKIKNLSKSHFSIIHFACHGFIHENPLRAGLILSEGKELYEDGLLQVREIYSLNLNADLVVLSACQTGKGLITQGEGLLGISRVFFYSGTRSVISTLWNIQDESTSLFMKFFYGFFFRGDSKTEALRKAKIKIREKYPNPFYWAPYILNGDFKGRYNL